MEEQWCFEARRGVLEYLAQQEVDHGEVGQWPAWHVAPVVSIWAVESVVRPGSLGWWVIYGDLPTDYVSAAKLRHPRDALAAIAQRWADYVATCRQGRTPTDFVVGDGSREVLDLLGRRAAILAEWVGDDEFWERI